MKLQKILVATDFSPNGNRAIDAALQLVRNGGGSVTLLHVCQLPAYSFAAGPAYVPSPELVSEIVADTKRGLEAIKGRCLDAGVAVETDWLQGDPASEIVRYATSKGFDLIVLATHGRRGVRRLLLGSVAESVVRHASQPVLTVRAEPAEGSA